MKAVESDRVTVSDPWPSVEMRIQVTRNTKMLEETVPAYLHRCERVKIEFVLLKLHSDTEIAINNSIFPILTYIIVTLT